MTEKPAELPFATFMDTLRGLRKLGRDVPEVDTVALFAFSPVPLIVFGALFGGIFPWLALIWITAGIFLLDKRVPKPSPDAPEGSEFPAADRMSRALAITHFLLLPLVVAALAGFAGISGPARIALFLAAGLWFGQVSNANAHELIHRADRRLFALGKWVYISLLYGHHTSAHRLVHHVAVATPNDPSTATLGESYWSFAPRAWIGAFKAGHAMEKARIAQRAANEAAALAAAQPAGQTTGKAAPKLGLKARIARLNPYVLYVLGGSWFVLGTGLLFGWAGVFGYLLLCGYAQMQLLLSDYVQHYGLTRREVAPGVFEPASESHSWDAAETVSSLMMLNAPRHSDHHAHPARPYPALQLGAIAEPGRPILPRSLPAMAALALFPAQWAKVMDHRVLALRKAEAELAPHVITAEAAAAAAAATQAAMAAEEPPQPAKDDAQILEAVVAAVEKAPEPAQG